MTIINKIGMGEVLAQLAEESAELAQAALKLRRTLTGKSPTPVPYGEAIDNLLEELADVAACVDAIGLSDVNQAIVREYKRRKLRRWMARLGIKEGEA